MLASIHPLGEQGRRQRWGVTVTAYLVATVAAAALVGGVLGLVGQRIGPPGGWATASFVALAAAGVVLDLRLGGLAVPTIHRQVNEQWLDRYRGWVYGASFGFQLGLGVVTVVSTFTVYLALAAALAGLGRVLAGAIGLTFGVVRGATILAASQVRGPDQLRHLHQRLAAWDRPARQGAIGVQAGAAVAVLLVSTFV